MDGNYLEEPPPEKSPNITTSMVIAEELVNENQTSVMISSSKGNIAYLISLFERMSLEDFTNIINLRDNHGWTALLYAVIYGKHECVVFLVEHGANVNLSDGLGWSPLIKACKVGNFSTVLFLLERGANINSVNFQFTSPLLQAVKNGHIECVQLLIERGANIYALGSYERKCESHKKDSLLIASEQGYTNIVKMLLSNGANTTTRTIKRTFVPEVGMINVNMTCITIASDEYRPYIKQTIERWPVTMFILVCQHLHIYQYLDAEDYKLLGDFMEDQ